MSERYQISELSRLVQNSKDAEVMAQIEPKTEPRRWHGPHKVRMNNCDWDLTGARPCFMCRACRRDF